MHDMAKKITFNLSASSVRKAQKELLKYKKDLLMKCQKFTERLAAKGILVAQQNVGKFGNYIVFSAETSQTENGAKTILYATNTGLIKSQWVTEEGIQEADVSPILMAEFGSGLRADNTRGKKMPVPMGTGTFPEQTHAEDPNGWWYMDLNEEWHHSYGVRPSMPMWNAANEIFDQIRTTAKEVFG